MQGGNGFIYWDLFTALYYVLFNFCMTVWSDMFNKKVKVIIGVNSLWIITCTLFTVLNTELFEKELQ